MKRRHAITQADVTRLIKGAQAAGVVVAGVEIDGSCLRVLTDSWPGALKADKGADVALGADDIDAALVQLAGPGA